MNKKILPFFLQKDIYIIITTLIVLIFHIFLRFKDVKNFLVDINPLSGFDGYYYAFLSKLLLNKDYTSINYFINVPDFSTNLFPPPLISLIPIWLYEIFGISLEKSFFYLPVIFSIFFIFPLYFWLRTFIKDKLQLLFLLTITSLAISFNPIYYARTSVGRNDTDSLILFFIFLIYSFFNLSINSEKKGYFYIIFAGLVFNLFMWWYYKPVFSLVFIISLIILLILNKNTIKSILSKVVLFILTTNPILFLMSINAPIHYFISYTLKTNLPSLSYFYLPIPIHSVITELRNVSIDDFVLFTTGSFVSLIIGLIGYVFFSKTYFRYVIPTIPILAIGLTTFWAGNRFIIYLIPFIGLGISYFGYIFISFLTKKYLKSILLNYVITISIFAFLVFISVSPFTFKIEAKPIISDKVYIELNKIKQNLKEDSYILSWLSWGNTLRYVLDKGTFISNANFNPYKIYGLSQILMTDDENYSIYTLGFLTNNLQIHYKNKIKNIFQFSEIIKKRKEFPNKKVYIVVFNDMYKNEYLYTLSKINKETKNIVINSPVKLFFKCLPVEDQLFNCALLTYDKSASNYKFKEGKTKELIYKTILIRKDVPFSLNQEYIINEKGKYTLEIIETEDKVFVTAINKDFEKSMINRMFIYEEELKYFSKLYSYFPYFVIYETKN